MAPFAGSAAVVDLVVVLAVVALVVVLLAAEVVDALGVAEEGAATVGVGVGAGAEGIGSGNSSASARTGAGTALLGTPTRGCAVRELATTPPMTATATTVPPAPRMIRRICFTGKCLQIVADWDSRSLMLGRREYPMR